MTDSHRVIDRQLALARRALTPSAAFRDRVQAQVLAAATAPPAASALVLARAGSGGGPWAALRASGKAGALLGVALLALGFGSGYLASALDATPPPLPAARVARSGFDAPVRLAPDDATSAPADDATSAPADDATSAPDDAMSAPAPAAERVVLQTRGGDELALAAGRTDRLPVPRASKAAAPRAPSVEANASEPRAQDPSAELTLLQRAERAVRADNPALARALTDEHGERFPGSALSEEREAIERMALCQADGADASERAASFLRAHPQSVYASRLRELCRMQPPPEPQPVPELHAPRALPALTKPNAAGH